MATVYNDVLLHHVDGETDNVLFPQSKSKLITLEKNQEENTLDKRLENTPRVVDSEEPTGVPTILAVNASLLDGRSIEDIEALIATRARKSYTVNATLLASNWTDNSDKTYSMTISVDAIDENTLIELTTSNDITTDQIKAYQKANILGVSQGKGTITLKAINSKPTIDLPITIIIRGDLAASASVGDSDSITTSDEWSIGSGTTTFNEDGSITETNGLKTIHTVFVDDNTIESTLTYKGISKKKTTTFNEDGSISEVVAII